MTMTQPSTCKHTCITRRTALTSGVALTSGLVVGGLAPGIGAANDSITTRPFAVHHFVRAAGDSDPGSPQPSPPDLLVERAMGNPVDNGTIADELDGTRQLRWGSFRAINGRATLACVDGGTHVNLQLSGLVPGALYTIWVVVFAAPGFVDTRELGGPFGLRALDHMIGVGSLGAPDGSQNTFRARGSTGRLDVVHPAGPLSVFGSVGDCLFDAYEVRLVGIFHLDDRSHGPEPGPVGTVVNQLAFSLGTGV